MGRLGPVGAAGSPGTFGDPGPSGIQGPTGTQGNNECPSTFYILYGNGGSDLIIDRR